MMVAAKIVETVPWIDAKYYAATQTMDEARHTEVFAKYLHTKLGEAYPMSPFLEEQIDALHQPTAAGTSPTSACRSSSRAWRWPPSARCCGATEEPLLKKLLRYVMSDEARHVAFGVLSLAGVLPGPERRRAQGAPGVPGREHAAQPRPGRLDPGDLGAHGRRRSTPVLPSLLEAAEKMQTRASSPASSAASSPSSCPTSRKLGLLDANNGYLRKRWGEAGLLEFEFADDTGVGLRDLRRGGQGPRRRGASPARRARMDRAAGGRDRRRHRRGVADGRARADRAAPSRRRWCSDALDDAGLTLADIDGVCHSGSVDAVRRVPRHPAALHRLDMTGGSVLRGVPRARGLGHRRRRCASASSCVFAQTPRASRTAAKRRGGAPPPRAGPACGPGRTRWPSGRCRTALRRPDRRVRAGRQPAHGAVRHDARAAGDDRGEDTREWATLNPRATSRDPITVDDVLASDMVASPLHKLDCCLVTDGAGAFIVTSAERAQRPAQAAGVRARRGDRARPHDDQPDARPHGDAGRDQRAEGVRAWPASSPATSTCSWATTASRSPQLLHFEDLGFCAKGEGGAVRRVDGNIGPGGALPTNTNGGGLSYTHPGMYGMFLVVEAVRQLRGECGAAPGRRAPRSRSPTARAWCCRACRPSCSARRRRCDGAARAARRPRSAEPVLGGDADEQRTRAVVPRRATRRSSIPREVCPRACRPTRSSGASRAATGRSTRSSVQHRPANPTMADRGPYAVALVEVDAGDGAHVRVMTQRRELRPDDVTSATRCADMGAADRRPAPAVVRTSREKMTDDRWRSTSVRTARAFRDELREWLEANQPDGLDGVDAERPPMTAATRRSRAWPRSCTRPATCACRGRRSSAAAACRGIEVAVMNEEFARAGVPRVTRGMGEWLVGPSIIVWGTDEQKAHFLPRIIDGTDRYCQGFSEPDAGSDLAGLKTRGVVDGDEVVITGQKVWTSGAQHGEHDVLPVPHRPGRAEAPGHLATCSRRCTREDGSSNGFELRPIKQMTGGARVHRDVHHRGARAAVQRDRRPAQRLAGHDDDARQRARRQRHDPARAVHQAVLGRASS